ncbi:inositol-pentakisphosphate 2-kinase [Colletotrichum orchidophilum]|uniref:Inositol-pentakisphosphate 2-kinase n=1 Tax=Colletotrichum orchidophilum TaxID=1209926 RepID=A0A1G4ATH6_9PEZI|nr:inositol-pentakisphosphate 2-kinase [Colletotrichum orchidophilum]OHE92352.1 inositol-pentakisphosphate 2-kinase [Colletotrichum orchidophilum]
MVKLLIPPTKANIRPTADISSRDVPPEHSPASGKVFNMGVIVTGNDVHISPWTHAIYVGEGAANVLFIPFLYAKHARQDKKDRTEDDLLTKYLLRVPKQPKDGDKPFYPPLEQWEYFWNTIAPLFTYRADMLADMKFAFLPKDAVKHMQNVLDALNKAPAGAKQRPAKFRDNKVMNQATACLIESMRARSSDERVVEFKPKWLAQSPSAPKTANTCRCCALAAKKFTDSKDAGSGPRYYPCPLWLDPQRVAPKGKEEVRQKALASLFQYSISGDNKHAATLYGLLEKTSILTLLKKHQTQKDPRGPLNASKDDEGFSIAMTLRDCSLYMRYRVEKDGPGETVVADSFEAKLADLDKKNVSWKFKEWQDKERALIDEGWYTGRGKMVNCALQG